MGSWHSAGQDPRVPQSFAPANVEAHAPVRGVIPGRCYQCGYLIPATAGQDEWGVHAVPAACEYCSSPVSTLYRTTHDGCAKRADARRPAVRTIPAADDNVVDLPERESDPNGHRPHHPRYAEVVAYLKQWHGTNTFLLDMQATVLGKTKWDRLTYNQTEAVGKFIDNEKERASRPQTGVDLTDFPTGRTNAAVDNEQGGLTFLLIDHVADTHPKWGGWVFVKQQQGPNEVRLGSQRPGNTYSGQWPALIQKVLADIESAVRRYGLELGVCGVCHKPLTNDESRTEGIGPVCRAKLKKQKEYAA